MKKLSKKRVVLIASVVLLAGLCGHTIWSNTALEINEYTIRSQKIPQSFDGFRIAQVSDLHNDSFGENNVKLLNLLREARPDMIVITGDLVDGRRPDVAVAMNFVKEALKIAQVYYVTGNHEAGLQNYREIKAELIRNGVSVLDNRKVPIIRNGQMITLIGVNDTHFWPHWPPLDEEKTIFDTVSQIYEPSDGYTILLSHRPDLFDTYVATGVDLVFSGHAHGGQFRIPFLGGLFAPDQGLFPKYDAGQFAEDDTTMIVSRGLGASIIPLRINNSPEIVVVTLESKNG